MKSLIAAVALLLLLTPALAQTAPEPQSSPAQPPAGAQAAQPTPAPDAQQPSVSPSPPPAEQPQSESQIEPSQRIPSDPPQPLDQQPRPLHRRPLEVSPAVRPRPDATAYPVSRQQPKFSVGAKLLSDKEVEQRFSTPLGKHYLVVEVGFFPADAQTIKLRTESFALRPGTEDQAFFPATPRDIASALGRSGSRPGYSRIYPSVGVGYENGPWGRGVSTGVGVGVDGRPYPRRSGLGGAAGIMENELQDKSFPEGNISQPVAGYLYFPITGKRAKNYNLELIQKTGETVSLPLPEPKK